MTPDQFTQWLTDYQEKFPSLRAWLEKLSDGARKALLRLWRDTLESAGLDEALAASRAMATGKAQPVGPFDSDREQTAVAVLRVIEDARSRQRSEPEAADVLRPDPRLTKRVRGERQIGGVMARVERLIEAGKTPAQAADDIFGDIPASEPRRLSCAICGDTGLVSVWHPRSMQAHQAGTLSEPRNRVTAAAPCSCPKGEPKVWTRAEPPPKGWRGWVGEQARYSPERHCLVKHGDVSSERAVREFRSWCTAFFERAERLREEHERRYFDGLREPVFDAHNGEF